MLRITDYCLLHRALAEAPSLDFKVSFCSYSTMYTPLQSRNVGFVRGNIGFVTWSNDDVLTFAGRKVRPDHNHNSLGDASNNRGRKCICAPGLCVVDDRVPRYHLRRLQ